MLWCGRGGGLAWGRGKGEGRTCVIVDTRECASCRCPVIATIIYHTHHSTTKHGAVCIVFYISNTVGEELNLRTSIPHAIAEYLGHSRPSCMSTSYNMSEQTIVSPLV